jgi:plasmid stabilization system protein ParE
VADQARITFAASAIKDLDDMQSYYAGEGVHDVGTRLIAEIITKIERLGAHPLSGRVVPEFHVEHLREIIYPPFRIVYRYDKNKARIVRIWRSERILRMPRLQQQSNK